MAPERKRMLQWVGGGAAGLAVLAVAGIAIASYEAPPREGKVIEERFTPAHWEEYQEAHHVQIPYTVTDTDCSTDINGHYSCQTSTHTAYRTETYYTTEERFVSDDWDVQIQACKVNDEGETKCRTNWIDVSHATYEQCHIGSFYREETHCLPR